jgi:GH24 family phage-related lysozyme (muramidase)
MDRTIQFISNFVPILNDNDIKLVKETRIFLLNTFKTYLNDNQVVALTSLIQDIGWEAFMDSQIPQCIFDHKLVQVTNHLSSFNKTNRSISIRKAARRHDEVQLFWEIPE